ncbi:WD40-repeat-containing domain protein [Phyllosticta capitalensis]|uniref:Mitochondrial division protein 1 n=1 Tax=Phyllosticta capitalensis TaxID=121624 RepID=A0ABR1YEK4_9PEZI
MDDLNDRPLKRRRSNEDFPQSPKNHSPYPDASPSYNLPSRPVPEPYREDDSSLEGPSRERTGSRSRSPQSASQTPQVRGQSPSPYSLEKPGQQRLRYKAKLKLSGHKKAISCVKFSPDGRWIASASADATIKIWDARTGKIQHTLEGHMAGISTIAWAPDSRILASGSDDKYIRLWDAVAGKDLSVPFEGHHNYVFSLAISPKGNMIVSGSYDEAVFLWDVRTARVMKSLPAHSDPVGGVDFVRDGTMVVSCSSDGLIRVWDTSTGQCLRTLVHEDNAPVTSVRFSPNGKYILAWTLDSSIRLWDYITGKGKCVKTYQGHTNSRYSLSGAFGTYGKAPYQSAFIASGSECGAVFLWDVSSKDIMQKLDGHDGAVMAVDTHPTEPCLVSAGLDKTIRLWTMDGSGGEGEENGATGAGSTPVVAPEA